MTERRTRPFGLWTSPITPRGLAEDRRLEAACWDSDGRTLVWLEGRSGRGVLVAQGPEADAPRELTPELDVRAEVGYGGGDFTVHGGCAYFVVHKTGRIWRQRLSGGSAQPITPPFGKAASPVVSPDGRWVVYVHHDDEDADRLAVVDAEGKCWPQVLAEGHDFFMQPRVSPDGRRLAWIAWDHPNMPWDGTRLFVAPLEVSQGSLPRLGSAEVVAGGPEIAVFQPEFAPDGRTLLFVSDETGWGRIAACDLESGSRRWLTEDGVEYGAPAWVQGMRNYAISADGRFVTAAANRRGVQCLERIELATGRRVPVETVAEYAEISQVVSSPDGDRVVFVGSGPATPPRIVAVDFSAGEEMGTGASPSEVFPKSSHIGSEPVPIFSVRVAARASAELVPQAALARCEPISWVSTGGEPAHGLYYAPASDRFTGIDKPPLVVMIHGGPTAQAKAGYNPGAQFFATRGYAVLLVNYRGSTGYGRQYMLKLRDNWGVCDVEDALTGKDRLVEAGCVDPSRTVIMGGSAGGFTVLRAMTGHPEAFAAGVCLYGVADQFHLAAETHKFEAHYLDSLLGPLPQSAAIYRERSPLGFAARIRRPLAVFQGDEDHVVPRRQSDAIVEALKHSGVPHVYHVYEGEGHGWRKRETIEHFYGAVEAFLRQYVIFA